MSDQPLLRIGAFSRASSLSVKTLRAYHKAGLLVPDQVDSVSGYRSYSVAQLTDAVIIRRLRELDVPLEAIRQVVDSRNPGVTKKVLFEHNRGPRRAPRRDAAKDRRPLQRRLPLPWCTRPPGGGSSRLASC